MVKKIFISQPMSDKTDEEIMSERNQANVDIKTRVDGNYDYEIIDSFFQSAPHDANPLWFLGKSFELLSTADIAYFCKGWNEYRGCKMEHQAAVAYGIPVVEAE